MNNGYYANFYIFVKGLFKTSKMRRTLFSIAVLSLFAFSCGEAGIGFNIGKEFPVDIPVEAEITDFGVPVGFNPPALPPYNATYELGDVGDFSEDIDNVDEVIFNKLSYQIDNVETSEEIDIDEMRIDVILDNGTQLTLFNLVNDQLSNTEITEIELSADELQQLKESLEGTGGTNGSISSEIIFDFAEVPNQDLDFIFRLYFDVTVKIRDL